MVLSARISRLLEEVDPRLREVLTAVLQEVEDRQRRWEEGVLQRELQGLRESLGRLAEAQRRTEERLEQLAEAQRRTERELAKLAQSLRRTREQLGGLARSVAYALENEAFAKLPAFLKARGITVLERMVRTEVAGEEINLFGRVRRDGEEMLLVGEATLRLDDASKLRQLKQKAALVEAELGQPVLAVLVTHFATRSLLQQAQRANVLVVQSFEW